MHVPFNAPSRAIAAQQPRLTAAFERVTQSGWLVHGPEHGAFQDSLAHYLGVEHVFGVASGTDALEIALRAVTTDRFGAVVTAANAGGYTSTAARLVGLPVKYCDVSAATHCLDIDHLATALDSDVSAVVVTHLYGRLTPHMREIVAMCHERSVTVIEDCAQSIGARDGLAAGAFADIATFSFYPTKNLGALGDGGAIATSRHDLAERIALLRQYGWRERYRVEIPRARNSRLDELQAAILNLRLEGVDQGNARRRAIIEQYAASAPQGVDLLPAEGDAHAGHLAVLTTAGPEALSSHLAEIGVATAVHYPIPDYAQPAWADPDASRTLTVTESLRGRILSLPLFPELTDDEVDHVCKGLSNYEPK